MGKASMSQEQETIFREIQRFRQPALWLFIVFSSVALVGVVSHAVLRQLVLGKPAQHAVPDAALVVFGCLVILLILGLPTLLALVRLVTEVRLDGLYFGFFPFQRSLVKIEPSQLKNFEMRVFKSVAELRTWGDKKLDRSHILTVNGNYGVHVELTTGERWFIGSQRPDQLAQAILLAFKIPKCKRQMQANR
jgi:hypothetical protein